MKDLISIIIPFFNSASTLDSCIKSVLSQSIDNYEILLIDNSSTDNSKKIAIFYSEKYKFIHYYNIKNRNVSLARNTGLKNANGNIICFVDSDDIIHKNYLKIMYENFKNNDLVICSFTTSKYKLNDRIKYTNKFNNKESFKLILKNKKIRGYVWNKLFKKDIIRENNIIFNDKLRIGEDIDFVFDYLRCCNDVVYVNSNLYYYNMNSSNTVNNINNYKYALESWISLFNKYKIYNNDYDCMDLINYFYLKKYYELKYYKKDIKKSNEIYFSNRIKLNYKIKLFIYKNLTFVIIFLKKVRCRN